MENATIPKYEEMSPLCFETDVPGNGCATEHRSPLRDTTAELAPHTPMRLRTPLQGRPSTLHVSSPLASMDHRTPPAIPSTPEGRRTGGGRHTPICNENGAVSPLPITTPVRTSAIPATPSKRHQKRKFMDSYFFLKNLNALPMTPEQKKKERNTGPFCRRALQFVSPNASICGTVDGSSSPLPLPVLSPSTPAERPAAGSPTEEGSEEGRPPQGRFTRPFVLKTEESSHAKANIMGIATNEQSEEEVGGMPLLHTSSVATTMSCNSNTQCTPQKRSPPPQRLEESGEGHRSPTEVTRTLTPCRVVSENSVQDSSESASLHDPESRVQPTEGHSGKNVRTVDVSVTLPKYDSPEGATPVADADASDDRVLTAPTKKGVIGANTPCKQGFAPSGNIQLSGPLLSRCKSLSHLNEFVACFFDDLMDEYKFRCQHVAFDVLYKQMVAIPATIMLENCERRILCIQRDAWMRELIELEGLILPPLLRAQTRGRSRSRSRSRPRSRSQGRSRSWFSRMLSGRSKEDSVARESDRNIEASETAPSCAPSSESKSSFSNCERFKSDADIMWTGCRGNQTVVIMDADDDDMDVDVVNTAPPVVERVQSSKLVSSSQCLPFISRRSWSRSGGKRKTHGVTVHPAE
uniref:Uncharacterized protein TCIL3000_11_5650 n=1 Tax=Trypanosoma congolense (strain IL3000) TaxID=1068625 RepID=G0V0I0_TRYCI|nr:unnamed protein product [Trypanosoma congolense IL3000]